MRTTLNLDDALMEEAGEYAGVKGKTALLHEGLRALIQREAAARNLKQRADILRHLRKLKRAEEIDLEEGLHLLDSHSLAGRGLSWSDVELLAAARIDGLTLWTRDRALGRVAAELDLTHAID